MVPAPARKLAGTECGVTLQDKPLAEPELVHSPRPMTGLFATLTVEQKKMVLDYCGEESFGDPTFARK
jgi:hypothetical protein